VKPKRQACEETPLKHKPALFAFIFVFKTKKIVARKSEKSKEGWRLPRVSKANAIADFGDYTGGKCPPQSKAKGREGGQSPPIKSERSEPSFNLSYCLFLISLYFKISFPIAAFPLNCISKSGIIISI